MNPGEVGKMLTLSRIGLAMIALFMLEASDASTAGSAPASPRLPAIYPPKPGACYVLLKPDWEGNPHVEGGDYPVCHAMLDNLNRFCDEPPQYERRKLHPRTRNLREPAWQSVDVQANPQLVKEVYDAQSLPQYREGMWEYAKEKIRRLTMAGQLRLWRADIDLNLRDGEQTVYLLENSELGDPLGHNQPRLMFSERGSGRPSEIFSLSYGWRKIADLWLFRSHWYLVSYSTDYKWFTVREIHRSTPEPAGAITRCTIQHLNDREVE